MFDAVEVKVMCIAVRLEEHDQFSLLNVGTKDGGETFDGGFSVYLAIHLDKFMTTFRQYFFFAGSF